MDGSILHLVLFRVLVKWESPNGSHTKYVVFTVLSDKDRAPLGSAYTVDDRYIRPAMWLSIEKEYK